MATAVLAGAKVPVSGPFHITSHQRITGNNPHPSSSRSQQPSTYSDASTSSVPEPSTKTFQRIRSSLEQSLRTATRSKKLPPPPTDEFATITARSDKGKEREKVTGEEPPRKDKERSKMLRRLESKVTFRRGRESLTPSPLPPVSVAIPKDAADKVRAAGFTSFVTPSMRQGSMSSPSLHLSSQAMPSPKSRPAIPASSSSNSDAIATPTRERTRRTSLQPPLREISPPAPLGTRGDSRGHAIPGANQPSSRHRATKSTPLAGPSSPSIPLTPINQGGRSRSPETPTPTRRGRNLPSPPGTPTPMSSSKDRCNYSGTGATSSGHLTFNTPPGSPTTPRASSPIRTRSPSARTGRVVTPSHRGLISSSASHLPITTSSPSPTSRRPSVDVPRRPLIDTRKPSVDPSRRTSVDSPRRASVETPRPPRDSPSGNGAESPSPRPRPISPGQRSYAQNRHFNISSVSLSGPANPEHRELIRTATSMLCKEIIKIPPHMARSESGIKDWEEVGMRMQALVRSERIWGKSGGVSSGSSSNLNSTAGMTSSGLSASGEERERRLFHEALRDGFVLCQYVPISLLAHLVISPDG